MQRYLARALLQVLIPATAAVAGLGIVMSMVPEFYLERLVVGAIFMAATLPPWRLYRRGEYLPGIRALLVSLYLVCVGAVLFSGGIYEPAYIAMFAVLVMSVWFVPRSVLLLFLAAFLVLGLGATELAQQDLILSKPPPNGVWYSVVLTGLGGLIAAILVTVRRRLQASLEDVRRTSTLLTSVFAAIDDTVVILDDHLAPVETRGDAATGPSPLVPGLSIELDELLGLPAPSHPDRDETVAERLRALIRERTSARLMISYGDGPAEHFIEVSAAALGNTDASPAAGIAVLLRDATPEMRERRHWAQGQKMEAIGQLASGVAHDFNNILGSIRASSELLDARGDPHQHACIQTISDATRRASVLTRSMLLHAGATAELPSTILAASLLEESVALLAPSLGPNVDVTLDLHNPSLSISAVPAEIQGVLLNLAINGAHATDGHGEVSIQLRAERLSTDDRPPGTERLPTGEYVVIVVKDNGTGIERHNLEQIFRPFFTTKLRGQGTGLGLSNALSTIHRAGGTITVKSVRGVGSAFSVWLPSVSTHPQTSARPPAQPRGTVKAEGLRLVIIDDEPLMRRVLSLAMKRHGISARTCGSGEEGLRAIRRAPKEVDVVLLDLLMPGMSGVEVFRQLQQLPNPPKTILMTGFAENQDVAAAIEEGACAVVHKPFDLNELIQLVRDTAAQPPPHSHHVSMDSSDRQLPSTSARPYTSRQPN